jgi:hypothetical protein
VRWWGPEEWLLAALVAFALLFVGCVILMLRV